MMSFFADFTYEGSRSITGPYLGLLGAGALTISVISGAGEFIGYNIRLFSGRGADRTGRYWPITIGGYMLQMSVVPLLALAGSWQVAAVLIIAERVGKGDPQPAAGRDALPRGEGHRVRLGIRGARGAGPVRGAVRPAARRPGAGGEPARLQGRVRRRWRSRPRSCCRCSRWPGCSTPGRRTWRPARPRSAPRGCPRVFWIYLAGAALAAAGFADFPLIAYHFQHAGTVSRRR